MSRPDGMQLFRATLQKRMERIARATKCKLELIPMERGEVTLVASWDATKAFEAGSHRIVFTRLRVLGKTANLHPIQQRMLKKTCRIADETIAEILRARGII